MPEWRLPFWIQGSGIGVPASTFPVPGSRVKVRSPQYSQRSNDFSKVVSED